MDEDVLFIVRDVFSITGRGTVLAGEIVSGSIGTGDELAVPGPDGQIRVARVTGAECGRRLFDRVSAGQGPVGVLIDGVTKEQVARESSVRLARSPAAAPDAPTAVPAGWYADPGGHHELRYWNGGVWTATVADAGATAEDPLTPAAPKGIPERVMLLGIELERATRPGKILDLLHERATIYETLGMQTEADRDRLAWAAIKEGHSGLSRTSKVWAAGILGLEYGSTFSAAYDLSVKDEGKKVRVPLMRAGRAIALGYCPRCGSVQQLNERLHCGRGHTQIEDIACVVPADVAEVRAALQAAHAR